MVMCYSSNRKLITPRGREGGTGKREEKKTKGNVKKKIEEWKRKEERQS